MKIVSRQEALRHGARTYFTGKACPAGHIAKRFTSNFACEGCLKDRKKTSAYRAQQQEWKRSEMGKQSAKKYERSSKGRASQKRMNKKRHAAKLAWQKSPKGRATKNSYEFTSKGMPADSPIQYPATGRCQICNEFNILNRRLYRDHNHSTLKDRGWLCHNCNSGLGHFDDNPQLLNSAIAYLERANGVSA